MNEIDEKYLKNVLSILKTQRDQAIDSGTHLQAVIIQKDAEIEALNKELEALKEKENGQASNDT